MDFSIFDPQVWLSLLTLTILEIILGIDNVIFVSVAAERLPPRSRDRARKIGIALALLVRLVFLAGIAWIIGLKATVFAVGDHAVSWRDIVLLAGGLFLLAKGTSEIHAAVEGAAHGAAQSASASYLSVITQIVVLDVVFSLDSIVTAVGMTPHLAVMYAAVIISMVVMMVASGPVAGFIRRHPTVKMLALSFLLLIGVALVADGLHFHIPKGYLYFAVAFSIGVEALNLVAAKRRRRTSGGA